jgi:class 3 adenylate cyclase
MSTEPNRSSQLEIAHVLFMDIPAYSRLPVHEQAQVVAELRDIVRGTAEFRRAKASDELFPLSTRGGMGLVFLRDPVAPVQCAMQIARALQERPNVQLRMGLHSGPVYRVVDINQEVNFSGPGINIAVRVMDCGDAGHILLSSALVEMLGQVAEWPLHDLGECRVKHDLRVHLYNLHTDELGNPEHPENPARPRDAPPLPHFPDTHPTRSLDEENGRPPSKPPV